MATAKKLPSGNWRIRVYDKLTHSYKSFTEPTKKAAEKAATNWLVERDIDADHLTFKQAAEQYIDAKRTTLSPKTIEGYELIVKNNIKRFNNMDISLITPLMVQDWVNELTVSKAVKTVYNMYGFFKSVMSYHDIPIKLKKITLPQKTRTFKRIPTAEEVIEAFKGSDIELPVLLAVWCGLRMSEILGIRRQDIEGDILTINQVKVRVKGKWIIKKQAKTTKSKRQIKLPQQILDLIPDQDPVIPFGYDAIYDRFHKVIDYITFHDLRHVNASVMAALNIPDLYAMERGGWSNTMTLKQVYQQTFTVERQRVDQIIDKYFSEIYDSTYDSKKDKTS